MKDPRTFITYFNKKCSSGSDRTQITIWNERNSENYEVTIKFMTFAYDFSEELYAEMQAEVCDISKGCALITSTLPAVNCGIINLSVNPNPRHRYEQENITKAIEYIVNTALPKARKIKKAAFAF